MKPTSSKPNKNKNLGAVSNPSKKICCLPAKWLFLYLQHLKLIKLTAIVLILIISSATIGFIWYRQQNHQPENYFFNTQRRLPMTDRQPDAQPTDEPAMPPSNKKILWIAPIWHRLDSSFALGSNENFWQTMTQHLGGDQLFIKIAMTAHTSYLNDTKGPNNGWEFDPEFYDYNRSPEHENDNLKKYYEMAKLYNLNVFLNMNGNPWGEWEDCPAPAFNKIDQNETCTQ